MWALLSPRPLFSILVGFGAVGLVLHSIVPGAALFAVAALGGLAFEFGLMRPLWNFLFRFESAPALTLESCIGDEARAATSFDAKGNGLVVLESSSRGAEPDLPPLRSRTSRRYGAARVTLFEAPR